MIQPTERHTGLRPFHGAVLVGTTVVAVLIAFAAFHFVLGAIALVVKLAIIVAIVSFVARLLLRHAHS
jgi:hypothetical protein